MKSHLHTCIVRLAVLLMFCLSAFFSHAGSFEFLGGTASIPTALSADGSVVVGSRFNGSYEEAFRWTISGGISSLGTLGGNFSTAAGVSSDGSIIVGESFLFTGYSQAFRWTTATGMTSIGDLGGGLSRANGISSNGSTIVGKSKPDVFVHEAFRWTASEGMTSLGALWSDISQANAASADGGAIVGTVGTTGSEAFRWTPSGGMVGLGKLTDEDFARSEAYGVSADGSVVIGFSSYTDNAAVQAFRWTASGGMVGLGTLGGAVSRALGVSANGSVIVGDSDVPFVWDEVHGMRDLAAVLSNDYGMTLPGSLSRVRVISGNGLVFAGTAFNSATAQEEAFRVSIESPVLSGQTMAPITGNVQLETGDTLSGYGTVNGGVNVSGDCTISNTTGELITLTGGLRGPGSVYKIGAGSLAVKGSGTVNGHVIVRSGALQVDGGTVSTNVGYIEIGSVGDASLTVENGGAVLSAQSVVFGLHPSDHGTGSVTGSGSRIEAATTLYLGYHGTATLTVESGGTIAAQTLSIGDGNGTGTLNLNSGGTLEIGGVDGIRKGSLASATLNLAGGTIKVRNSALSTSLSASLSNTTTIDTNGLGATFSGILSGPGGLSKTGGGTLTLTAANSYAGQTTVSQGTLSLGASGSIAESTVINIAAGAILDASALPGGFTLSSGQQLAGNGTIAGGFTLGAGSQLAPGNSPGSLTFLGDLTLGAGSFTSVELGGLDDGEFDTLSVDLNLIYGGTLSISLGYVPQIGDSFQLFTDFNTQSGSFGSIDFLQPGLAADFNYSTGVLQITAVPEPSACVLPLCGLVLLVRRKRMPRSRKEAATVLL